MTRLLQLERAPLQQKHHSRPWLRSAASRRDLQLRQSRSKTSHQSLLCLRKVNSPHLTMCRQRETHLLQVQWDRIQVRPERGQSLLLVYT